MREVVFNIFLYLKNLFIGVFDQGLNTILLGSVDETISSRTGRAYYSYKGKWFVPLLYHGINTLFFFQEDHCGNSIEDNMDLSSEIWSWIKG